MPGKIYEIGSPRYDLMALPRPEFVARLERRGVAIHPEKKIVLYAPTWRGELAAVSDDGDQIERTIAAIEGSLDLEEYQVLAKPHHLTYTKMQKTDRDLSRFVPPTIDANCTLRAPLLSASK